MRSGLATLLTGAQGKRTKFQKEGHVLMLLKARSRGEEEGVPESIVKLDDAKPKSTSTVAPGSRTIPEEEGTAASDAASPADTTESSTKADGVPALGDLIHESSLARVGPLGLATLTLEDLNEHTHLLEAAKFLDDHEGQVPACRCMYRVVFS